MKIEAGFIQVCYGCEGSVNSGCFNVSIGAWPCASMCELDSWQCGRCVDGTISTCFDAPFRGATDPQPSSTSDGNMNTLDILSIVLFSFTSLFLVVVSINRIRMCVSASRKTSPPKALPNQKKSNATIMTQPKRMALGAF